MTARVAHLLVFLVLGQRAIPAAEQERVVEMIVPALAYGAGCSSELRLRNLSDRRVAVEVEGHKASGALAPAVGLAAIAVRLGAREQRVYKLEIEEETTGAWVKVRERVPSAGLSPVVAVSATIECVIANQLRTVGRDVAFPTRNPWFSSDVSELHGGVISLINTSERVAKASACYSTGGLYSVPGAAGRGAELQPICSTAFEVQVPPFGSLEFPVEREGSSHFVLKTVGETIVLEMLRPVEANVRVYAVDSSIRFEGEVAATPGKR
ncbi:MAG TPA: hypothetical protein VGH38_22260 [Bryobacteraceae bacterium]